MITSLRYNLGNLLNLQGRETRSQFWPYFAIVVVLAFASAAAVVFPEILASMERMQRFAVEHPELATVERGPASYSISIEGYHPELMPDIGRVSISLGAVIAVSVFLLAGAVVRRLHDRGKSGLWALAPVSFLLIGLSAFPILFTRDPPNMGLFFALFLNNALYLGALIYLVVLLSGASTVGANKFGGAS